MINNIENFKFITTIEARMTSTRMPGKVIEEFGMNDTKHDSKLTLELLVERIRKSKYVNEIILATTKNKEDDILVNLASKLDIKHYRGSELDVLSRLAEAINIVDGCDYVIQLTGDNPLIDPEVINYVIEIFIENFPKFDFVTNNGLMNMDLHEIPLGMDVSIFSCNNLKKIAHLTEDSEDREHPTLFFYRGGKSLFKVHNVTIPSKWKRNYKPRLTLDTTADFKLLNIIYNYFIANGEIDFGLTEILSFLDKNKNLVDINKNISHKIPTGLNEN